MFSLEGVGKKGVVCKLLLPNLTLIYLLGAA